MLTTEEIAGDTDILLSGHAQWLDEHMIRPPLPMPAMPDIYIDLVVETHIDPLGDLDMPTQEEFESAPVTPHRKTNLTCTFFGIVLGALIAAFLIRIEARGPIVALVLFGYGIAVYFGFKLSQADERINEAWTSVDLERENMALREQLAQTIADRDDADRALSQVADDCNTLAGYVADYRMMLRRSARRTVKLRKEFITRDPGPAPQPMTFDFTDLDHRLTEQMTEALSTQDPQVTRIMGPLAAKLDHQVTVRQTGPAEFTALPTNLPAWVLPEDVSADRTSP